MRLFAERPGNMRNGNKCREIFEFQSCEELPDMDKDSMFLFFLTRREVEEKQAVSVSSYKCDCTFLHL